MTRAERAKQNFMRGLNCAQAVCLAFSDLYGELDEKTALKLAAPFGGGVGRLRELCGALSGCLMAAGMIFYDAGNITVAEKSALYAREQEIAARFRADNGSIVCRELLSGVAHDDAPQAEERTAEYYRKRPCPEICARAAAAFEQYLKEQGVLPAEEKQ